MLSDVKMYALLLAASCFWVFSDSLRYNPNDYRKRISLESAQIPSLPESRIIGGEKATIEEYPFAVSLQNNGTFFGHDVEHFCGGGIIGEKWIITSAQCALRIYVKKYHVRAGTSDYYKNGVIYGVRRVLIHPRFNNLNYDNDVGLIELSESIQFDEQKQPIKLPKAYATIEDGSPVRILGWGATRLLGPVSDELQYSVISKISNQDCVIANGGSLVTQRMLCVYSAITAPCIGDSGSPLIFDDTLYGVASWTKSCVFEFPTAYTAISEVKDWITEITGIV